MDGKMLTRLGAVVFAGIAIIVTVIELRRTPEVPEVGVLDRDHIRSADRLRASLRHCRDIGEAATRDSGCLKAWAENRDRFLGQVSSGTSPTAAPPTTAPLIPADATSADDPVRKQAAPAAAVAPEPDGAR